MQPPPRPSILQRPVRPEGSRANEEQAPREHAKEQQRLAVKAQLHQQHEERMLGAFYGTQEDKRRAWSSMQREAEQLAEARARAVMEQQQRDAAWVSQGPCVVVDTQRPWTAASSTYYMPPEVEAEARRRAQREADVTNRMLAQRRAAEEAQRRAAEQEALRRTIQAEDTWFNRGAASEHWIQPEHRIKHRNGVVPQFMPGSTPYCRDDEPSGTSSVRPVSARRAADGQGMAALLRQDPAPNTSSNRSFSAADSGYGSPAVQAGQARPQTAPSQQQQRQYPWSSSLPGWQA